MADRRAYATWLLTQTDRSLISVRAERASRRLWLTVVPKPTRSGAVIVASDIFRRRGSGAVLMVAYKVRCAELREKFVRNIAEEKGSVVGVMKPQSNRREGRKGLIFIRT